MFGAYLHVVIVHIELHLAYIGIINRLHFEVNNHITSGYDVVEHQIRIEMLTVNSYAFLSPQKGKTATKFKKELLYMRYNGTFKFRL